MARTVPEWRGANDDAMPPPRVRQRIFEAYDRCCYLTKRPIRPGDEWHLDHKVPLILGGENREDNLAPVLAEVHRMKTAAEMKVKAKIARVAKKHSGIAAKKSKPFPGGKASRFKRCVDGTVVDRRTGEVL